MSQADIIKEFLVGIGYKVDGASEKKVKESVAEMGKTVAALATAAAAAATAVAAAVVKISAQFDQLYWSSQRTGATVQNIRAFAFAVSQMGGSAADAQGSIEGLGRAMRNPGIRSLIQSLGVATEKNGKLRDTVEIMGDLGKVLGSKPRIIADQYAQILGIDDRTLSAMIAGTGEWQKVYNERQKALGLDPQKAAESAKKLMQTFRDLQDTLKTVFEKLTTDFSEPMLKAMQDLDAWLKEHYEDIKKFIGEIADAARKTFEAFRDIAGELKPVWEGFDRISKSLTGDDGLTTAFKILGGVLLLKVLAPLKEISGLLLGMATLPAWAMAALSLGAGAAGKYLDEKTGRPGVGAVLSDPKRLNDAIHGRSGDASPNGGFFTEKNAAGRWLNRHLPSWLGGNKTAEATGVVDDTPLKSLISRTEGTANADPYNTVYANGRYLQPPRPVTDMTLNEVLEYQRQGKAIAGSPAYPVGRGQFIRSTLQRLIPLMGLDADKDKLTPEIQERMFSRLIAETNGNPATLRAVWDGLRAQGISDAEISQAWAKHLEAAKVARNTPPAQETGFLGWVRDHLPSMSANAATFDEQVKNAALAPPSSSIANDNSRSVKIGDTHITVHGSGGDPEDTASAIKRVSEGSQAALLRNVQGAVR